MKKINKIIAILLMILVILSFFMYNKVNANAAIFYPSEVEININNLPQNEKVEIEIMVVINEIDTPGKNTNSWQERIEYLKELNDKLAQKSDGSFRGFKNEAKYDSETKQWKYEPIETTYYYKSLNKKTISGKENIKLNIFPVNKILYEFQDGMVIRINDKYSMPSTLGNLGQPEISKNYYSLDYETMKLERIYGNDGMASTIKRFYDGPIFLNIILCVIFTLIIELVISKIFKIANTKIILKINLLTQILLHSVTLMILSIYSLLYSQYIWLIIIFELIIITSEFLLYKKRIKDISSKKLIAFSIIANICSFLISPIIYILINNLL